ncbi:DNA repair protein RadC [Comamonadaceae bacterium M7527]|nr:DNA repair protein RadC [Comamonadaceae bacterium M7527]
MQTTWPNETRPREKLHHMGAASLSDTELLALLLRTGTSQQHVLDLASAVLAQLGGLAGLLSATPKQLSTVKGLGPAKQAELCAVAELAKRATAQHLQDKPAFTQPHMVKHYLQLHLAHQPAEHFAVLFLDTAHHLLALETLFQGTINQTSVYPREVLVRALQHGAAAVILAHNHPSGCAEPSPADIHLTHTLREALRVVDVRVLDHMVVTQGKVYSMAEQGLL